MTRPAGECQLPVEDENRKNNFMNSQDELRRVLEQMGKSGTGVASTLRATNVLGVRNAVRVLNPIVRYVQITTRFDNLDADVMTGKTFRVHENSGQEVVLLQAIQDFLDDFNRGAYPELELPPE